MTRLLITTSLACLLSACAAVGVTASDDPRTKLRDAYALLRQDRPYPAERLMREAITGFQEKNDPYGLGLAQLMFGQFVKTPAFDWPLFREQYPNTETSQQRTALASRYLVDAAANFRKAAADPKLPSDERTGYHWREYLAHKELEDRRGMCGALRSMNESHAAFRRDKPNATVHYPRQYSSFEDYISAMMREANCGDL
jgi:hypothetical protein